MTVLCLPAGKTFNISLSCKLQKATALGIQAHGGSVQGLQWQWERPELPRRPHLIPTTLLERMC